MHTTTKRQSFEQITKDSKNLISYKSVTTGKTESLISSRQVKLVCLRMCACVCYHGNSHVAGLDVVVDVEGFAEAHVEVL